MAGDGAALDPLSQVRTEPREPPRRLYRRRVLVDAGPDAGRQPRPQRLAPSPRACHTQGHGAHSPSWRAARSSSEDRAQRRRRSCECRVDVWTRGRSREPSGLEEANGVGYGGSAEAGYAPARSGQHDMSISDGFAGSPGRFGAPGFGRGGRQDQRLPRRHGVVGPSRHEPKRLTTALGCKAHDSRASTVNGATRGCRLRPRPPRLPPPV